MPETEESTQATASENQLVTFELDGEEFGFDIMSVQEITRVPKVSRLPRTQDYVEGLANLRGVVLPIIDTRTRFHLPRAEETDRLVSSSGQEYILPIEHVRDLVRIPSANVRSFRGGRFAHIRERILPIAPLESMLGEESGATAPEELCVAVMTAAGRDFGVVVDKFHDEVESIIKPLPAELSELPGLLGATIMGDGRIVLVVNPEQLAA